MATAEETFKTDLAFKSDLLVAAKGDLDIVSGVENVRLALFHRLMTSPGSLIHRPTYGVGIKDYQNAPNSLATYRALALRIQDQFAQDPRVESVQGIKLSPDPSNPSIVNLFVRVKLAGYEETTFQFTPFSEGI